MPEPDSGKICGAQNQASCCHSHVIAMAKKPADVKAKRSTKVLVHAALEKARATKVARQRAAWATRQRRCRALAKAKKEALAKTAKVAGAKGKKEKAEAPKAPKTSDDAQTTKDTSPAARIMESRVLAKAREWCFGCKPPNNGRPLILHNHLKELFLANVGLRKASTKRKSKYHSGRSFLTFMLLRAAMIATKDPVDHTRLLQASAKEWALLDDAGQLALAQKIHEALPVLPCMDIGILAGHIWLDVYGVPH